MMLMTKKDVLQYLDIKNTTFYNYIKKGLPVRYPPGGGKPYCYKEEIDEWLKGDIQHERIR